VIYSDYTGRGGSIQMHVTCWDPRWISRTLLYVAFDYPFNQLGVKKIFGHIRRTDVETIRFALKAGFKAEAGIEGVYPDDDMLIMALYRDDCRFLGVAPTDKVH